MIKVQFETPIKFEIFALSLFENLYHYDKRSKSARKPTSLGVGVRQKLHQVGDDVYARGDFKIDAEYMTVEDLDNAVVDFLTEHRTIENYKFADQ